MFVLILTTIFRKKTILLAIDRSSHFIDANYTGNETISKFKMAAWIFLIYDISNLLSTTQ